MPLFVEELTKSVLESGLLRKEADRYVARHPLAGARHPDEPARLTDGAARPFGAGAASGANRRRDRAVNSPTTLLRAVSRLPEDELQAALARLVASELVFQRGTPPDAVYTLQARAGAGRGLQQHVAQYPPGIARADRRSARNPFPPS